MSRLSYALYCERVAVDKTVPKPGYLNGYYISEKIYQQTQERILSLNIRHDLYTLGTHLWCPRIFPPLLLLEFSSLMLRNHHKRCA